MTTRRYVLLKPALEQLEQHCDPEPYLEETRLQRSYSGPKAMKMISEVNYAVALRYLGREGEALDVLRNMPAENTMGFGAVAKTNYYRTLMYAQRNDPAAEEAFQKMMESFGKVKSSRHKKMMMLGVAAAQAELHRMHKEYDLALQTYPSMPQSLLGRVCEAWFRGKVYFAMGDMQQAKREMEFVAQNGNKLYIATEAKALLENINTEE